MGLTEEINKLSLSVIKKGNPSGPKDLLKLDILVEL